MNMTMDQDTLDHRETLFVIPTTDSSHITLPLFTQSIISNFCVHRLLNKGMKFLFIVYFSEFLAASDWEEDTYLHPEGAAFPLRCLVKEGANLIFLSMCWTSFKMKSSYLSLMTSPSKLFCLAWSQTTVVHNDLKQSQFWLIFPFFFF